MSYGDWTTVYERLRNNAMAGKKRRRFEFELVDAVDVLNMKEEDIFDFIDETVEIYAIAYGMTREDAAKTVYANLIYIVGYYDDETASKWRELVHKRMGLPEPNIEVVE
jgi:hypothetical protein